MTRDELKEHNRMVLLRIRREGSALSRFLEGPEHEVLGICGNCGRPFGIASGTPGCCEIDEEDVADDI